MKRVLLSITGTVFGLVALLSFKSHGHPIGASAGLPSAALPASAPAPPVRPGRRQTTAAPRPTPSSPSTSALRQPRRSSATRSDTRYGVVQVQLTVSGSKIDQRFVRAAHRLRRALAADQQLRRAHPAAGDTGRAEREHRHRLRRDLHQRRATSSPCRARWTRRASSDRHRPRRRAPGRALHGHGLLDRRPRPRLRRGRLSTRSLRWLHWVDATFSTYQPDSQISRLGRGELTVARVRAAGA